MADTYAQALTGGQRDRFIGKLGAWMAEETRDYLEYKANQNDKCFKSPIEMAFWLAWLTHIWIETITGTGPGSLFPLVQHETQANGRQYRLDFAFVDAAIGLKIAVELDGHDFHERTPEQVDSRNTRDADLHLAGWDVFHFSGRQILSDPSSCVGRVHDGFCDSYARWRRTQPLVLVGGY